MSVSNFHQLWKNLQCQKNKSIIIYVTYRPPDTSLNCFEDLLKPNYVQALTLNKQILVLGDLNCNMLENGQERRALTNFSTELNLTQIIKTPTRITATSQTLIDVILVSSTALVLESGVINTSISDHLPVYVLLKLKAPKMPACSITTSSYKNYNPSLFSSDLVTKSDRLLSILSNTNVNTILETFKDVLHSTLDVHAPLKTFKIRNRPCPYVTNKRTHEVSGPTPTSFPGSSLFLRKDPGWGWSRVSRKFDRPRGSRQSIKLHASTFELYTSIARSECFVPINFENHIYFKILAN